MSSIKRSPRDEEWLKKYLAEETITVATKDLYCVMLHLLRYRTDLSLEGLHALPCELCKLDGSLECVMEERRHINNIARRIGLVADVLVCPRGEYPVHIDVNGRIEINKLADYPNSDDLAHDGNSSAIPDGAGAERFGTADTNTPSHTHDDP